MTIEEVEDLVRQLTAVAHKLEARAAKQSIQEAFQQLHAYADEYRYRQLNDRSEKNSLAHDLFRSNGIDIVGLPHVRGPSL
jgi:hypothetical protein